MNKQMSRLTWLAVSVFAWIVPAAQATVLTFGLYTNQAKTQIDYPNGSVVPQTYGDNVSNFEPTNQFGSYYYSYGTNGGLTPGVTVEYRYINWIDYTNTGAFYNGPGSGSKWDTGYSTMTNVIYNTFPGTGVGSNSWWAEVRFTSTGGGSVKLLSFDVAPYLASVVTGQTFKVVRNANNSPVMDVLWSAGPDESVSVSPGITTYTPNVEVTGTNTLSLIFGRSSLMAVDNITFALPEPSILTLFSAVCLGVLFARRRSR